MTPSTTHELTVRLSVIAPSKAHAVSAIYDACASGQFDVLQIRDAYDDDVTGLLTPEENSDEDATGASATVYLAENGEEA